MNTPVFKNAQLVLPHEVVLGSVSVHNGLISSVDQGPATHAEGWNLQGDYLMPGFVEMHTDNFERHLMPRPKVQWAEMPALLAHDAEVAAAGITTVFDALGVGDADPDSLRGSTWNPVIETLDTCAREGLLRADHHLHVRCELPAPNTIELFAPFHDHPRLSLISLMDHTPGQRQWENIEVARVYYTGKKGWSNEKFERQVELAGELQARYAAPHRAYFVNYCQTHRIALASHDDTTVAHVKQAHAEGASMSEFPTTLLAAKTAHELGLLNVMGGPNVVRGGSHSGNVAAADLARHGLLDILSSDYVPGSLLSAAMRLVDDEILSLPQAIATVSHNPAKATGLNDRGQIAVGLRADLIQVRVVNLPHGKRHAVVRAVWREGQRVL
ncbi:MAG: phosphonate metabolism protein PhnM [Burkholderiales bacterium 35-55-47]|jgi:alpha-D-ribose 1-methylphosphonate 5-triphosphate diphosphatase|uniref:alpha-D-ribose 1-methylphosphonate 5-triphosphate diphosphatase n=1 Tax=Limnohabitans sp. TaxID=1907725 RepID=UPI000BD64123|nr:alpha-D-ribose 1-methylphosphonate 5-triphosphate diphosphatase [Limnohabitans sp.]OYY18935.1 MAG: phosphonate metabolism protein PhnM [Burkholderiales bacterium 35-55-47]OYZ73753.1 MAG: phosphonate metabolism protein PhnM [Burkholderiales bacterium 24-55-52]OZB00898.1 MAG: phosphonate metabolism protein PhnM [Burkholderiales bacterium 39-55-53]HQR85313.1 alpha-D-ribose 1-methylphosphonate 5-triphosphate diphosphatase [Limnohabitans sp.]HQS27279.1 alpha-D-ribose 1-methylphosphonate 5-tripho